MQVLQVRETFHREAVGESTVLLSFIQSLSQKHRRIYMNIEPSSR